MTETRDVVRGAGTLAIAGVAAAVLGWATLVVVARTQGPGEYADFSVIWSVYFGVAGILIGLQQETTRSLVASREGSRGVGLVGAGAWATLVVLVAALAMVAVAPVAGSVGADDVVSSAGPAIIAIPLLAAAMMVNGGLAADSRWGALAGLALGDQFVRLVAVVLVVAVAPGEVAYGAALVAGLACYFPFIVVGWRRAPVITGTRAGFVGRSGAAMVSSGCANLLVVGLPALITVTGGGSDRARGVLFAAILLTRTPVLLLANAVRPVVVRVFVIHRSRLREWARRIAPLTVAATAGAALLGWALGPWALRLLFGPDFEVSRGLIAGLVVAAVLILLQTWTGVALAAIDRDGASTAGWLVAVVLAIGCLLLPLGLEERTLVALLVGPGVGLALHLGVLGRSGQPDA
jgi:O-antigen/teichoic acid export membrane protein